MVTFVAKDVEEYPGTVSKVVCGSNGNTVSNLAMMRN